MPPPALHPRGPFPQTQVVCSTLSGCGSAPLVEAVSLSRKGFDTVIVDEACQVTFGEERASFDRLPFFFV